MSTIREQLELLRRLCGVPLAQWDDTTIVEVLHIVEVLQMECELAEELDALDDDSEAKTDPCIPLHGDSAEGEDRAARLGKW